ncbi:MAG: helix-turn-helix domain-containing protein [Actinomycetes bacterium]
MSIGQTLTAARESAGMSVEQVSAATRIRRTLVEAIEDDDFAACGGDFYARGHVRSIAGAIGTDPAPLLAEFDRTTAATSAPRATDVFGSETGARPERRGPNWSAAMAAALVLVVVYGVGQAFVRTSDGDGREAGPVTSTTAPPSSAAPAKSPGASPGPGAVAKAPRHKVTVAVQASDTSWIQATTASGKELFQGLMQGGEERTFSDKARVKLIIGNAGAVTLTVNGTGIGAPGRPGQVARVQFTPQDPAAG